MGTKQVILEVDSSCIFHYISYGVPSTHVYAPLVDTIRNMMIDEDWNVQVCQVYREANYCADRLAKQCYKLPIGVTFFDKFTDLFIFRFPSILLWS